jgi:hypothetical protein
MGNCRIILKSSTRVETVQTLDRFSRGICTDARIVPRHSSRDVPHETHRHRQRHSPLRHQCNKRVTK